MEEQDENVICLFDVDGTLTKARQRITPSMEEFLMKLREKVKIGLVGGSDIIKIAEQMEPLVAGKQANFGEKAVNELVEKYDYIFAENGLEAFREGKLIERQCITEFVGEDKVQKFINYCLGYMSKLSLPCKRGNFIEYRNGLINICPPGRSVSQSEREQFAEFDAKHQVREQFVASLKKEFGPEFGLNFSIGGQISFDVFPIGWDKTFCLKYLDQFDKIYFFGDKTSEGGNDYEIYTHAKTIGYTVTSPEHTKQIVTQLFP